MIGIVTFILFVSFLFTGNLRTAVAIIVLGIIAREFKSRSKPAPAPTSPSGPTLDQLREEHHQQWLRGGGNCGRHIGSPDRQPPPAPTSSPSVVVPPCGGYMPTPNIPDGFSPRPMSQKILELLQGHELEKLERTKIATKESLHWLWGLPLSKANFNLLKEAAHRLGVAKYYKFDDKANQINPIASAELKLLREADHRRELAEQAKRELAQHGQGEFKTQVNPPEGGSTPAPCFPAGLVMSDPATVKPKIQVSPKEDRYWWN